MRAFVCVRCGHTLELPADPSAFHVDCPYCGTDNVLPPELIQARQRQHELQLRERAEAARSAERAQATRARTIKVALGIGAALLVLAVMGAGVLVLVFRAGESRVAATDPTRNGHAAMLERIAAMRAKDACDRILVQPAAHGAGESGVVSLDMVAGDHCVHVLGTSASAPLTLRYTTPQVALRTPVPPAAPVIDYRLCAEETANHAFEITSPGGEPFTVAALECARKPAEGGARSKVDDPATNGVARAKARLDELFKAGCNYVVAQPTVQRGKQTFTFTSKANAPCLNAVLASQYEDVRLQASLTDPDGFVLPVPPPGRELRVMYCPAKEGKYTLSVQPSSWDHYAEAAIDCPRDGREGLRRANELRKPQ